MKDKKGDPLLHPDAPCKFYRIFLYTVLIRHKSVYLSIFFLPLGKLPKMATNRSFSFLGYFLVLSIFGCFSVVSANLRDDALKNGLTNPEIVKVYEEWASTIIQQGPRYAQGGKSAPRRIAKYDSSVGMQDQVKNNMDYFIGVANVATIPFIFAPFCLIFIIVFWSGRYCCNCACLGGKDRTVKYTHRQVFLCGKL